MKVLFIANKSEFGGATKCMLELIELLIKFNNVEVELIVHGENFLAKWCKERNIKYYAFGHVPFAISKGSTIIRRIGKTILTPFYYIRARIQNQKAFRKACKVIDFNKIDIIHTNSNRDCFGAMLAKKYDIPHVWHLREFGKEDYDIRYLTSNYIEYMNLNANYFIAVSDSVKNAWIRKGLSEEKLFRIYDGIALPKPEIVAKADTFKQMTKRDDFRFAYLGIVCPSKGQYDAVKALSYIETDIAKKIHIDFWGDCTLLPEYTNKLKKYAIKKGILSSISFKGFTNNIWAELPNYDGALVCSRSEAFGRITPEYMSLGLQVIASDTGSNPEIVENGESGYIYRHNDLNDLTEKIKVVYDKSIEERAIMAFKAKERAKQFTDIIHAENINGLYKKILISNKGKINISLRK